jgi:hypothetical protein
VLAHDAAAYLGEQVSAGAGETLEQLDVALRP